MVSPLVACQLAARWRLPEGTQLEVRLGTAVSSYDSKPGTAVLATLAAPVVSGPHLLLPAGTIVSGRVTRVRRVGLGLVHETAALEIEFNELLRPDGEALDLRARLVGVDNASERVSKNGRIQGRRTTNSLAYRSSRYLTWLALNGVEGQAIKWLARGVIAHVPDPEIYYPIGADLMLQLTAPLDLEDVPEATPARPGLTGAERDDLASLVRPLPYRTYARGARGSSDLINLLFVGSREQLEAAFAAAGWSGADPITVRTTLKSIRAAASGYGYREAPVSPLFWLEAPSDHVWQKGLNTMAKRHHLRVWKAPESWNGRDLWVGAGTKDISYAYFRPGQKVTHRVEEEIDQERSKILNDLDLGGALGASDWIERPEVPCDSRNSSGDRIVTDGRLAVILLKDLPDDAPSGAAPLRSPPQGNLLYRLARRQILIARNDLLRGNVYWKAFDGLRWTVRALRMRKEQPPSLVLAPAALVP